MYHPIIDRLKRIAELLPTAIGGELPDGMTHTGSGEIMFASRTTSNTVFNHGLSFTPKLLIVWTLDNVAVSGDIVLCIIERELFDVQGGTAKTLRNLNCFGGSVGGYEANSYSSTDANLFITDTTFNIGHSLRYYSAGATYHWFAFD